MHKNGTGWKVWLMASMVLVFQACRPEPDNNLTLRATAAHAYDAQFVEGIELELERRVLENGEHGAELRYYGAGRTDGTPRSVIVLADVVLVDEGTCKPRRRSLRRI